MLSGRGLRPAPARFPPWPRPTGSKVEARIWMGLGINGGLWYKRRRHKQAENKGSHYKNQN